ncbi:MAG: hypothetical protein KGJ93_01045, partial [Patescibacteria group bacterium]|nr:hypothetical protein [Patescibacteria group bacterium]
MKTVPIKRVRREKKRTRTGQKVLSGIGIGGSVLGGAAGLSGGQVPVQPEPPTRIVSGQNQNQKDQHGKSASDKIKDLITSVFGVQKAKADYYNQGMFGGNGGGAGSGTFDSFPDVGGGGFIDPTAGNQTLNDLINTPISPFDQSAGGATSGGFDQFGGSAGDQFGGGSDFGNQQDQAPNDVGTGGESGFQTGGSGGDAVEQNTQSSFGDNSAMPDVGN